MDGVVSAFSVFSVFSVTSYRICSALHPRPYTLLMDGFSGCAKAEMLPAVDAQKGDVLLPPKQKEPFPHRGSLHLAWHQLLRFALVQPIRDMSW